jgi:hypothetical protein
MQKHLSKQALVTRMLLLVIHLSDVQCAGECSSSQRAIRRTLAAQKNTNKFNPIHVTHFTTPSSPHPTSDRQTTKPIIRPLPHLPTTIIPQQPSPDSDKVMLSSSTNHTAASHARTTSTRGPCKGILIGSGFLLPLFEVPAPSP